MKLNRLYSLLTEVRVVPTEINDLKGELPVYPDTHEPIADTEVIRVYHGFDNVAHAVRALTRGLSGKERVGRNYSYEANNNPKGLFVTLDLKVAKRFGNYIIEFHAKASDLEAPVWPNGSYTVQGQMSGTFGDEDEREAARMKRREEARSSKFKGVRDSDRPELGDTLLANSEYQALFTGELNPNSIRAIWVNKTPEKSGRFSDYTRMNPKEFLKDYEPSADYRHRILQPREQFNMEEFLKRMMAKYPQKIGSQEVNEAWIISGLNSESDSSLLTYVWPNQLAGLKAGLQKYKEKVDK